MRKKLIINADDYGRAPGVSRGILQAHREGIVTSTTVMINQPDVEPQLTQALACPELGIGLHLVFSAWRPVLPPELIPSLVDPGGSFLGQHDLWARAEEISAEYGRDQGRGRVPGLQKTRAYNGADTGRLRDKAGRDNPQRQSRRRDLDMVGHV